MSAIHGKKGKIFLNGFNITQYSNSANLDRSNDVVEVTTFGNDSKKYIDGLKDGTFALEGVYDDDKDTLDAILESVTEKIVTYFPDGDIESKSGYSFKALKSANATSISITENVNFSLATQTNEGVNRVLSLGTVDTLTTETNTSVDLGSAKDGLIVYIHVFDIDTDADVIIEDSADDITFVVYDTINVSAIGSSVTTITGAIDRYIRLTVNGNSNINVNVKGV